MNSHPGSDTDITEYKFSDSVDSRINRRLSNAGDVYFKILVPSIAAGAVIGKGGESIARIQKESGAKVKMSKSNDFYPGTTERVCLILGTVDAIMSVHDYIMQKIWEKPEVSNNNTAVDQGGGVGSSSVATAVVGSFSSGVWSNDMSINSVVTAGGGGGYNDILQSNLFYNNPFVSYKGPYSDRLKQVKILVPNSTAGMIIGKGGQFIKEIKEVSGAYVQISQKSNDINLSLPERCVIIAGEMENNRIATNMILQKIAEDPQSSTCPQISYSESIGPLPSAYPTGSPFASTNNNNNNNILLNNSFSYNTSNVGGNMLCESQDMMNTGGVGGGNYDLGGGTTGCSLKEAVVNHQLMASRVPGGLGTVVTNTSNDNAASVQKYNMVSPNRINNDLLIKRNLQVRGYNERAIKDITQAIQTLLSYGIINNEAALFSNFGYSLMHQQNATPPPPILLPSQQLNSYYSADTNGLGGSIYSPIVQQPMHMFDNAYSALSPVIPSEGIMPTPLSYISFQTPPPSTYIDPSNNNVMYSSLSPVYAVNGMVHGDGGIDNLPQDSSTSHPFYYASGIQASALNNNNNIYTSNQPSYRDDLVYNSTMNVLPFDSYGFQRNASGVLQPLSPQIAAAVAGIFTPPISNQTLTGASGSSSGFSLWQLAGGGGANQHPLYDSLLYGISPQIVSEPMNKFIKSVRIKEEPTRNSISDVEQVTNCEIQVITNEEVTNISSLAEQFSKEANVIDNTCSSSTSRNDDSGVANSNNDHVLESVSNNITESLDKNEVEADNCCELKIIGYSEASIESACRILCVDEEQIKSNATVNLN